MGTVKTTCTSEKRADLNSVGTIKAICISKNKGDRKRPVESAELRADHGIVGDAHAGPWNRQVSLLTAESIEVMRRKIPELADGDFAENFVVSGLGLAEVNVGDRLLAGREVKLEVTQIGKECHDDCPIRRKTGDCIMPRQGIFCRVVAGGVLRPGDRISREL
jgi:MOSC domain-containing protein YiiM